MPRPFLIKAALALVVLWVSVSIIIKAAGKHISSPERVVSLISEKPLSPDLKPGERNRRIERVAQTINNLDFHQRQDLRDVDQEPLETFFESMDEEEKTRFVELTMEKHFDSIMHAFNEMEPEERQKTIAKVRRDMNKEAEGRAEIERLEEEDEEIFQKIVERGMASYYQEADADTKMDLAPLLEEMQARIQGMNINRR